MKESKIITLPTKDLIKDGTYKTFKKDIVKIKSIDLQKNKLQLYNITDQCNMWLDLDRHTIIERLR